MCGIVGVVGQDAARQRDRVGTAVAALRHRGPDGDNVFVGDRVALGHTRLAVIDPSTASDQPMVDEPSGCVLVFNGEIYNYRELRSELEALGHSFRSAGDTEVLLRSYLQWGDSCVTALNGMFAFAVWDPRTQSVFLARDRLGEKPLHLAREDGVTWFASEIKALLTAAVVPPRPDHGYLGRFLALGDLGHPTATPFAGVTQLPAAHAARADQDGRLRIWRYWDVPVDIRRSDAVYDDFDELFLDAVALRLRSDVPVGTSLSGGLDSSLVLATVRQHEPDHELHAFTASFPGDEADELPRATAVADKLSATLHPVALSAADLVNDLTAVIRANEGPVESPSTLAQYCVMREAHRAGVTVLLDGQGADETWAGYDKYARTALTRHVTHLAAGRARELAVSWHRVRGQRLRPEVAQFAAVSGSEAGRRLLERVRRRTPGQWLAPAYLRRSFDDPLEGLERHGTGHAASDLALADLTRITLPRLLRYADRDSMAWSREVRLPFLDHRLVELAARTCFDRKVVDGWTKEPIRRMLERLGLPDVARRRDKRAYMPPTSRWLADARVVERVNDAWRRLHDDGLLAGATPPNATLPRWRVLAVATWAEEFGVSLD